MADRTPDSPRSAPRATPSPARTRTPAPPGGRTGRHRPAPSVTLASHAAPHAATHPGSPPASHAASPPTPPPAAAEACDPCGSPAAPPAEGAGDASSLLSALSAGSPLSSIRHGACLVRATAIDLAILAAHMLLYPTGMLPEHAPQPVLRDPLPDPCAAPGTPALALDLPSVPVLGDAPHPPVLLLHGFVDNRSAFALLRRSLSRHGWTHVRAVNYSPFTPDLRSAAEQLGAHVERACEQSGRSRVDIVAHSLGGLIARYYVQCLGGDARVRTLVTLGTPHSGTRAVPAFTPHPLARQMRPGSPVLTELAAAAPGCRTRFVAFWSDLDQLMIPVGSARLEHTDLLAENVHVTGIGHLALPVHAPVAAEIRRALGERPLAGVETHAA